MKKKIATLVLAVVTNMTLTIPAFAYTPTYSAAAKAKAQQIVASIITPGMTDVQKVQACNDYLCKTVEYDYTFTNYTADSALFGGLAVCQGYSETFKLLMDLAGVPCTVIIDDSLDHAWNRVVIGGVPYEVDVTWNDGTESNAFTLLTADQMQYKHILGLSDELVDYDELVGSY